MAEKQAGKLLGPKDHDAFDDNEGIPIITSFDEMPLHNHLLRGIYSYGFEKARFCHLAPFWPLLWNLSPLRPSDDTSLRMIPQNGSKSDTLRSHLRPGFGIPKLFSQRGWRV